jgi:hypothetical protein
MLEERPEFGGWSYRGVLLDVSHPLVRSLVSVSQYFDGIKDTYQ